MACARAAPALLAHVSLLLAMLGGAGLATAARLKWDPTTYVVVRELFPAEYRAAAAGLCAGGAALLALAHLALLALAAPPAARRALLLAHAGLSAALLVAQAALAAWAGARVLRWLHSQQAEQAHELLQLRAHLQPVLAFLGRWFHLPMHVHEIIQEAEADVPRNLYAGAAGAALAAVLQPLAAALALLCAAHARRPRRPRAASTGTLSFTSASTYNEKAPLKTAYRNGKLVIVSP